jgi:repressor LexA
VAQAKITETERLVLEALCRALRDSGAPPTLEQIKESAKLPSLAAVQFFLDNLQRKRMIRRDGAQSRVIEVDCGALAGERSQPATTPQAEPAPAAAGLGARQSEPLAEAPVEWPEAARIETPTNRPPTTAAPEAPAEVGAMAEAPGQRVAEEPKGIVFGRGQASGGADPSTVAVPLLGRVAAGLPIDSVPGEIEAVYHLPRALTGYGNGPLFMLRVEGSSMLEAGIHDRDLVVVRRQQGPENGHIIVARDEDGDAVVKRFWRSDDGLRVELRSANPDFPPLDLANAELLGRVVAVIRTL